MSSRSQTTTSTPARLLTVGHGRLDRAALAFLLREAGVSLLVDVRRFPGSRNNPDVSRDALPRWLPEEGIDYRWDERLGGRRRLPAEQDDQDPWWRVDAFRAYAAHTRSPGFVAAVDDLVADVDRVAGAGRSGEPSDQPPGRAVAVMCSESVWWRCHRRLIADVVAAGRGLAVAHLMHDGRLTAHQPSEGLRRRDDGMMFWDGTGGPPQK